jgi:hypothetical protein
MITAFAKLKGNISTTYTLEFLKTCVILHTEVTALFASN